MGIHTRFLLPLLPDLCVVILPSFKYEQGPSRHAELTANTGEKPVLAPPPPRHGKYGSATWLQNCSRLTSQMDYANRDVRTQGDKNGLF